MVVLRYFFGWWPAKLPTVLNIVLMIGYCCIGKYFYVCHRHQGLHECEVAQHMIWILQRLTDRQMESLAVKFFQLSAVVQFPLRSALSSSTWSAGPS